MAFMPVRITTLRGDQKIGFDAYVEVAGKHILYLRRGDSFEGARLNRLKEKKLKKMHIREEDEQAYRQYLQQNIDAAYNAKSAASIENRGQIIQGLQQAAAEQVMDDPTDEKTYSAAKEGSQRFAEFLWKEDKAIQSLLAVKNLDQDLAHHGVTVSALAVEIARRTDYADEKNLHFLALGALLHDLGHFYSGLSIARPLNQLTSEELNQYRQHPLEGAKRLKDLKHMDLHVTQIVLEHEESIDGLGFPNRLTEARMNPLSIFVQSANVFDRLMTFEKMKPDIAIKKLFLTHLGRYPLTHLNALKAIVGG